MTDGVTTDDKVTEIANLRARLAELEGETVEEVEAVLSEAEESVSEVAESSQEAVNEAHETVTEAEHEVQEAVTETAADTAEELGHPELAGQIADELFRRLDERGVLPHTAHSEAPTVTEAVHDPAEIPAVQEAEEVVPDTPPEPQHWYYRPRLRRTR